MRRYEAPTYLAITLFFVGIVTWGSWRSYFDPLLQGTVERPSVVHLHAVVFVGWVLLLVAQAALGGAAIGRVLRTDSPEYLLMWLAPVLALLAVDLVTRRRVRAVPLAGGVLIVIAFFKVQLLAGPIWRDMGRMLLAPFV